LEQVGDQWVNWVYHPLKRLTLMVHLIRRMVE